MTPDQRSQQARPTWRTTGGAATSAQRALSRWAVWIAYGACVWSLLFAALSFYWALGGRAGVHTLVSPEIMQAVHAPWLTALLWATGLIKVFAGCVALALVQPWGVRASPRLLLFLAWGGGTLAFVHGALYLIVGLLALSGAIGFKAPGAILRAYTFLWGPWWLIGGALFLVSAWSYLRRSPQQRGDRLVSAFGAVGALALLILSGGTIG